MVEALLNLAWLVIAIGAICIFRAVWRKHKTTTLLEWVALGTFLFLLFPVISLTDDLHPDLEIAEAATSTKHFLILSAHGAAAQRHASHPAGSLPAVLGSGQSPVLLAEFAPVVNLEIRIRSSAPPRFASGRAPPPLPL
jgi:hypothetical protein